MDVPRKYGLVRVIAALLKVLAVIVLILGIVALVGSPQLSKQLLLPQWIALGGGVAATLAALMMSLQLYAFGSILSLLVKIEEHTRSISQTPPK